MSPDLEKTLAAAAAALDARKAQLDAATLQIKRVEEVLRSSPTPREVWVDAGPSGLIPALMRLGYSSDRSGWRLVCDDGLLTKPLLEHRADIRLAMLQHLPTLLQAITKAVRP